MELAIVFFLGIFICSMGLLAYIRVCKDFKADKEDSKI